ncbi:DUF5615 family PIN-like protein [Ancylothrix sp. C2]|uniref:DUF5615 family PIN-like protein n=1 Tax=Ancylothrix sp. D3o TaxID=2953691 RepID=UPI0021BABDBE|nr:DUF5615 family PIN-like protein [Ancylothrix sp. D3o]MCT7950542.1 DUF5615 family PIN-like protein [Ancylothrix sp. D3o]
MTEIRLYLDEDSRRKALFQALLSRGVDVITVSEAKMLGRSDEDQLNWALVNNRVIYTFNMRDFYRLHTTILQEGGTHAGIILGFQKTFSVGAQMRGIMRLIAAKSAEEMQNSLEFISDWIED